MSSEELNNFFLSCVFRVLEENRHTSNETVTLLLFINEDCNLFRTCRNNQGRPILSCTHITFKHLLICTFTQVLVTCVSVVFKS